MAVRRLVVTAMMLLARRISVNQMIDANHEVKQLTSFDKRGLQIAQLNDDRLYAASAPEYDAFGRVVRSVDANGQVRTLSCNLIGRVITSTDPLLAKRSLSYDAFGRILTQTDGNGASSSYRYDTQQRSVTVTTAEGVSITTMSNRHGQVQKLIDGNGNGANLVMTLKVV